MKQIRLSNCGTITYGRSMKEHPGIVTDLDMGEMNYASRFWKKTERYHDLAKHVEQNISLKHPGHFDCKLGIGGHCPFCATSVVYYEYTGERV